MEERVTDEENRSGNDETESDTEIGVQTLEVMEVESSPHSRTKIPRVNFPIPRGEGAKGRNSTGDADRNTKNVSV